MTLGLHNKWRRIAAVLASDSPIGKALDVATGTGDMAFELAAFENFNEIVGVDFVPEMIQLAKIIPKIDTLTQKKTSDFYSFIG